MIMAPLSCGSAISDTTEFWATYPKILICVGAGAILFPPKSFGTQRERRRVRPKIFRRNFRMTTKYVLSFLAATTLTTGIALAQQSTPPAPAPPFSAEPFGQAFSLLVDGGGFLGVHAEDI